MLIAIIAVSYILAINIFGFRIVKIQRDDRKKNGEPTPQPQVIKQLESTTGAKGTHTNKEGDKQERKTESNQEKSKSCDNHKQKEQTPHNGDKIEKDTLLAEEKLNLKRYERIPDLKILMVGVFGGALGEYIAFLVLKYRTTNTILMVGLPVLIALWIYIYYIIVGGMFIV